MCCVIKRFIPLKAFILFVGTIKILFKVFMDIMYNTKVSKATHMEKK